MLDSKKKYSLFEATSIAQKYFDLLSPYCYRIEIAGSIRRQKKLISDIEIVCIPKAYQTGLFSDGLALVVNEWKKVKGDLDYEFSKYTQRILPEGIKLDLFFAQPDNWASIFLIRTGDWEFSKHFVGHIMPQRGYKQSDGYIWHHGDKVEVKEEKELFDLMRIPFIEPKDRNIQTIRKY